MRFITNKKENEMKRPKKFFRPLSMLRAKTENSGDESTDGNGNDMDHLQLPYFGDQEDSESDEELGSCQIDLDHAESIIGGSSVISRHEGGNHNQIASGRNEDAQSTHKVFSFSLPFAGSFSPRSLPRLARLNPFSSNEDRRQQIKLKLTRQESISTLEEEYLFKDRTLDNSRVTAIKRALTPTNIKKEIRYHLTYAERPQWERIFEELDGDVLVLGGYRGSILRDTATKRRAWLPVVKAGFNFKKIDLYIGPDVADELNVESKIYPDGILSHIGPIDICKKLLKRLENSNATLHNYGYDWRLSAHLSSQKLTKTLQRINRENGGKGVLVIAHSMGGLIAHHSMQCNPELFRGILYVGVPSKCPNVLGPIRFGDNVLLSSRILSAEVNFMMRSSFIFLPLDGEIFVDKTKNNEKILLDFFDPKTWEEYHLSSLVCEQRKRLVSEGKDLIEESTGLAFRTSYLDACRYLSETLKSAKSFLLELEYDPSKKSRYPPLAIVYGNNSASVRESQVQGFDGLKAGDWTDFTYGPGDGVVHQKWLMPEKRGFNIVGKFASSAGHVSLMTDFDAIAKGLMAILNAEGEGLAK
ncbi:hypothetical protein PP7435_CHR2-0468 [Komagataella phaffii CBS 7435]|uniref:Uncharacterized protein n=2 Tax=Komagataella phaffii TaxID=460519 RepID=C4R1T7_KOMPG|nr:uncharacterized protein PAS_chr2-1_0802 [Komagataella phaffii GS115]AOA62080.1 GQ67_00877T0 [Komagataella phaffii]CAH2448000.1 hypothetical protein BQ9382_C2-2540 [Komagataella phaffii CBS 7435]AOA67422.1 GQ68_00512T0 [Komagataella phaffii GS115]CAY69461.1 Putative protein of unknown function [Komagataella phaffii GS115]CCA38156.1 hypothetical protein PP7435_CHR2-0468 [Komagataella phaffii CBS 7435]